MAGLQEISRFVIARPALQYAWDFMRSMGEKGCEGLAFFAGTVQGSTAYVTDAYVPAQKAYKTPTGLLVHVESDALHRFNMLLYERSLRFLAQIHSHGETAYHSQTDDEHSMITVLGGLSIVAPFFATSAFDLATCAVYRREQSGWYEVDFSEKTDLIEVVE